MCCGEGCSRCDLDADNPSDIVRPLCSPYANVSFLAYRLLIAVYFIVFLVTHLSTNITGEAGLKILLFLSDWTLILTTLYLIVAFLNGLGDYTYYNRHGTYNSYDEPPTLYRFQWFLFSVCGITSFLITTSFWSTGGLGVWSGSLLENLNLHALPAVVLFVDLVFTAVPVRCAHVVYPLIYGALYLIFAAIYWYAGGTSILGNTYIYPILDFEKPTMVVVVVLLEAVGALVFQWAAVAVCMLRNKVGKECGCNGRPSSQEEIPLTVTYNSRSGAAPVTSMHY